MAIKENIEYIKGEIDSQEQLLENAIKGEMFFKRHKTAIISALGVIIAVALFFSIKTYIQESNIKTANLAYSALLADPNNSKAKEDLKSRAPSLFALYALQKSDMNSSALIDEALNSQIDPLLKEILLSAKEGYSDKILSNYGALLNGYELLKQDKIEQAKIEFAKIPQNSNLRNIAKNLEHYQGK